MRASSTAARLVDDPFASPLGRRVKDVISQAHGCAPLARRTPPFAFVWRRPDAQFGRHSEQVAVPHFLGRYRVLEEIARGGMGIVVRAYDATLDREVAVKVLSPDVDPDSEIGRRFADEARIVSQLHHPGIVSVYDAGIIADGRPFFTMPFLQGHTLASVLANRADSGDEIDRFLAVFAKICGAVAHAHERRIVHRDLKPANVMLGRSDEVLVMDWGVAIDLHSHWGSCARVGQLGVWHPRLYAARAGQWQFGRPRSK